MSATATSRSLFLSALDWQIEGLRFIGHQGIVVLDDDRRATIDLVNYAKNGMGTHEHFDGVLVSIVSKTTGKIAAQTFCFDSHLSKALADRTDGRADYPLGSNTCFQQIAYCGPGWYIARPRSTSPFTAAVEDWIETWR